MTPPSFWIGAPLIALIEILLSSLLSELTLRSFTRFVNQYTLPEHPPSKDGSPNQVARKGASMHLSTESVSFLSQAPLKHSLPQKNGHAHPSVLNTSSSRFEDLEECYPRVREQSYRGSSNENRLTHFHGERVENLLDDT